MTQFKQRYYDWFSRFYDRFIEMHSTDRQGLLREVLAEHTAAKPNDFLLDICTGTGATLFNLAKKVGDRGLVVGLDFSAGMLQAARNKHKGRKPVCLIQADCSRLPFKAQAFAAITCSHAFYELKGITQIDALNEIKRCLIPGKPFLMMKHEAPANRLVRLLFYIRLSMMGRQRAIQILKHELKFLQGHFNQVTKVATKTGKSKIYICS